jgi:hypothetical protein
MSGLELGVIVIISVIAVNLFIFSLLPVSLKNLVKIFSVKEKQ